MEKVQKVINNKTKKIETRVQRQVLLEDGKIIADTGPQVISRTFEDSKVEDIEKVRGTGGKENTLPKSSEISSEPESEESEEEIIDLTRPHILGPNATGIVAIPVKSNPVVEKKSSIIKRDKSASKEVLHYSDSVIKDLNRPSDYKAAASNPNSLLEPMENDFLDKIKGKLKFYSNKTKKIREKDKINEKSRINPDGKINIETTHSKAIEEFSDEELPEQYVDKRQLKSPDSCHLPSRSYSGHDPKDSYGGLYCSDGHEYYSQYPGGSATTARRPNKSHEDKTPFRSPSTGRLAIGYQLSSPVSFYPGASVTLGRLSKTSPDPIDRNGRSMSRLSNVSRFSGHDIQGHSSPITRVYNSPSFDLKRWGLDTGKRTPTATIAVNISKNVMDHEKARTCTSFQNHEERRDVKGESKTLNGSGKRNSSSFDGKVKERENIRKEQERISEEIRRKDEKRALETKTFPSAREDVESDLKVNSQSKKERIGEPRSDSSSYKNSKKANEERNENEERSLFSAVPVKVTKTDSSSEQSLIETRDTNRKRPQLDTSNSLPTLSASAIPLPYALNTKDQRRCSPPVLHSSHTPLQINSSTVSSAHASVQASFSSEEDDDRDIEEGDEEIHFSTHDDTDVSEGQSKQRKSTELVKRRNQVSSFYFGTDDAVNKTEEESYVVHHRPEARIEVVTRETEVSERGDQKEDEEVDKGRPKSPEARIEKTAYVEIHPNCRPMSSSVESEFSENLGSGHDTLSRRAAERRQRGIFLDGHEPRPPPPPPASVPPATLPKPTSWFFTNPAPRLKSASTSPIHSPKMKRKGWDRIDPDPDYDFDTRIMSNAQGNYRLDITIEPEKVPEPPRVHRIFTTPSPTRIRKPWKPVSPTAKTKQMESVAKSRLFPSSTLSKSPSTGQSMIRSATVTKSYSPTNTKSFARLSRSDTKTQTTNSKTFFWPPSPPPQYRSSPTFVSRSKSSPPSSGSPSPTRLSPARESPGRGSPTKTVTKSASQRWPGVSASLTRPTISSRNKALSRS